MNGSAQRISLSSYFTHVTDVPSRQRLRSTSTNQLAVPPFNLSLSLSLSLSLPLSYSLLLSGECHEDAATSTSRRHAGLSCIARRLAVARPKLSGRRSSSTVLSQVCLGLPVLRRHSGDEEPTTVGKRDFPVSGANFWNGLPSHVTSAPSRSLIRAQTPVIELSLKVL